MAYLSEEILRYYLSSPSAIKNRQLYKVDFAYQAVIKAFLSHSHKDKDLVEGLINYLATHFRMKIYVDWQDNSMPRETNRTTANKIKAKIRELDYFIILATKNALESKWVPWEIGVADTIKSNDKIILIPVSDPTGKFDGAEYLQLYQSIQVSLQKAYVFQPNSKDGLPLETFIK